MTTAGTHHEQEGTASPESPPPEEPRGPLEVMRRQLEHPSALEDLGPLFGRKAQGQGTGRYGPARDSR